MLESAFLRECVQLSLSLLPVLLAVFIKVSLLLGCAFAVAGLLHRAAARLKHLLWLATLFASVLVLAVTVNGPLFHVALRPLPLAPLSLSLLPPTGVFAVPSRLPPLAVAVRPLLDGGGLLAHAWPALVLLVWATGTAFGMLRLAWGVLLFRKMASASTPAARCTTLARQLSTRVGVRRSVRVLETTACTSPLTRGILNPVILLPATMRRWPAESLRSVLLHELGHVARADSFFLAVAYGSCCLLWFIPPIWVAYARLYGEQEKACDAGVVASGVSPRSYAGCLLDASRLCGEQAAAAGIAFSGRRKRILKERIRSILDGTVAMRRGAALLCLAAALLALVVALCAAGLQPETLLSVAAGGTPQDIQSAIDSGADVDGITAAMALTPLMLAARSNPNPEAIRLLVKSGGDVNARERFRGTTPLLQAAMNNDNPEVLRALLEAGANLGQIDYEGNGVLQCAAMANPNPRVLITLLAAGAPVNGMSADGRTALMFAASYGNLAVIPALLQAGADAAMVSTIGKTAFELLGPRLKSTEVGHLLDQARR